jgi:hypothetical protein
MSIKIEIGPMVFDTKIKSKDYYNGIFSRYPDGQDVGGKDFDELNKLIEKHHIGEEKIGCGIKRIFRDKTKYGANCFWIERIDGTKEDFSCRKCIHAAGKHESSSATASSTTST